jgi:hypothetical protein
MSSWHTYPQVFNLGHKAVADLLLDPVVVQEKIDGSQISFGVFHGTEYEGLRVRSKGSEINVMAPEKMFLAGVEALKERHHLLRPGWTYRGEYLAKPKHNVLAYDRIPNGHIILFDINVGQESYLNPYDIEVEARNLGFEAVPLLHIGRLTGIERLRELLGMVSVLGGQKIEGVVIKNYARFGLDKKALMGKFVSEAFKEVHSAEWKNANPTSRDIMDLLAAEYRTPARWAKAVQHLREAGRIEDSPRDIGALFKEVPEDVLKEEEEAIKAKLFAWAWPHLRRSLTAGMAEWYKEELMKLQFEREAGVLVLGEKWLPPPDVGPTIISIEQEAA